MVKTKVMLSYKTRNVIAPISSKQDLLVKVDDKLLSKISYLKVEVRMLKSNINRIILLDFI